MKVLLINAYKINEEGVRHFLKFKYLLQCVISQCELQLECEPLIISRDLTNLDDFLYEI